MNEGGCVKLRLDTNIFELQMEDFNSLRNSCHYLSIFSSCSASTLFRILLTHCLVLINYALDQASIYYFTSICKRITINQQLNLEVNIVHNSLWSIMTYIYYWHYQIDRYWYLMAINASWTPSMSRRVIEENIDRFTVSARK